MGRDELSMTERIITEVARHKGVDETSLAEPLYSAINPESLETLFRETSGEVTFRYLDLTITATSDGAVDVRETDREEPPQTPD